MLPNLISVRDLGSLFPGLSAPWASSSWSSTWLLCWTPWMRAEEGEVLTCQCHRQRMAHA